VCKFVKTQRLDAWTDQGRRVAIWRTGPEAPAPDAPIVVLSAGFARRMRDLGSIALCLVRNGAIVYRFDSVDHIGLSDGDILDFTVTGIYDSWRAVIELVRATEGRRKVRLVGLSMAALAAVRLAYEDHDVESITAISGVIHGRHTLERVLDGDYLAVPLSELPDKMEILGHWVDPRKLWIDNRETGCLTLERTIEYLAGVPAAVANFVASDDPWVEIDECADAFARGAGGRRTVVRLPYSGHDLGRNPVAMTTMMQKMTELVIGGPDGDSELTVVIPTFDELLEVRIAERQQEADERAADRVPVSGGTSND
jgi:acyl transferase